MANIIGKQYNPYAMPSGSSGLIGGLEIGQRMARQRGLAAGMQKVANGDESGWKDIAAVAPEVYIQHQQQQEANALAREKLKQSQNGGAWTTDLGRMWNIANDPNQTEENRKLASQYLGYVARNPEANQGWNYAGRVGTLQGDLALGGQVEAQKTLAKEQAAQQGKYYGKEWEDAQKGWGNVNGEKKALKGSQAEQEWMEKNSQALKNNEVVSRASNTVLSDIDAILRLAKENPNVVSGFTASITNSIPGTPAADIAARVESIKGNIAVDSLLNIKKSGAGLGQVPQKQAEMLSGLLGNLSQKQSPEEFVDVLSRIRGLYKGIVDAADKENADIMSKVYDPNAQETKKEEIVDWSEL